MPSSLSEARFEALLYSVPERTRYRSAEFTRDSSQSGFCSTASERNRLYENTAIRILQSRTRRA